MDASGDRSAKMTLPHLSVAIATLSDRFSNLATDALPTMEGVTYEIYVQNAQSAVMPVGAERDDIRVTLLDNVGVAHSRNAAITGIHDGIILFADDDLTFYGKNYGALRQLFATSPDLDFVCGQLHDTDGQPLKAYSKHRTKATKLNTGKVGTPELAVRASSIRDAGVLFDTNFGAGSPLWLGDEYIFLCDALNKGLNGCHVNLVFGAHSRDSSGQHNTAETFAIRDKVLRRALGARSWPLWLTFACKSYRRFPDWRTFWRFIQF
jgi:hypothetical protein